MVLDIAVTPSTPVWLQRHDLDTIDAVKSWVLDNGWGALVINPGASARLESALAGGADYDASAAMTLIESSGRQIVAEMLFVSSALSTAAQTVSSKYAQGQVASFQRADDAPQPNYSALIHPVGFTTVDVAAAGFTMSPIMSTFGYLTSLLSTIGVLIMWKMTSFPFFARVRFRDLALMWPVLLLGLALVLSFYHALAFLAFRGPGYNSLALKYTAATFFKFWFTNAAVSFCLGLWLFNWFLHLTPHIIALPSICTVIPNVVSTISTVELAPTFYRIFYALPFFNGSSIILYIITGAHPTIGRNVGILVAEIAAMTALLTLSIWIRQTCVLRGISDAHGWFRGSRYFHSHIPYYKDARSDAEHSAEPLQTSRRAGVDIVDYDDNDVSLTTGNLGV
ncbi:hypothetical protein GGF43_005020 [Coemansia sp. RSA 2618]|nr:hypothetical protein GGF43_005020 [Coemansia sp. RSA 2618]